MKNKQKPISKPKSKLKTFSTVPKHSISFTSIELKVLLDLLSKAETSTNLDLFIVARLKNRLTEIYSEQYSDYIIK